MLSFEVSHVHEGIISAHSRLLSQSYFIAVKFKSLNCIAEGNYVIVHLLLEIQRKKTILLARRDGVLIILKILLHIILFPLSM